MRSKRLVLLTVLLAAGLPALGSAQGITIAPTIGAYIPAGSFDELETRASELKRGATLGLGFNLELGSLRGTLAYATGAKIDEEGDVQDREEIGDGSVLAATAGLV